MRGQNRGSGGFSVHLDYFQLAEMCISLVFTWFEAPNYLLIIEISFIETRPEGLLDPKIRDEMSDFLEIFQLKIRSNICY